MRFALPFRAFPQALLFRPAANDDSVPCAATASAAPRVPATNAALPPEIDAPEWNLCGRWLAYYLWMP